jgi:hypothetical protein
MDDSRLPTPEEILATHEEIKEQYDMNYTATVLTHNESERS